VGRLEGLDEEKVGVVKVGSGLGQEKVLMGVLDS
jgi:hypothetical protein